MPLKLKAGWTKPTMQANMRLLLDDGYSRSQAIVLTFNTARASYFKQYPHGALPEWLAYPKGKRIAKFYLTNGAPIREIEYANNPVRELDIEPDELEEIQRGVQKQLSGKGAAVRKAAALYTDFTGHDDPRITKVTIDGLPKVMLAIGQCDGVLYTTIRDGITEKYIHKFKSKSRPLLTASPDGKQLYLIGGSYDFTERGIVDK